MARHVAPHRWADALAGRVDDPERAAMAEHAATCHRCRTARDRVGMSTDAFAAIRKDAPPDLGWDSIRARVHWDVSSARRSKPRIWAPRVRLRRALVGGGIAAALATAAAAAVLATRGDV